MENITKITIELNNYSSSSSRSSGISAGVTIGYGDGTQTEFNGVSISASKSNMNSNGTTYQNGSFVNNASTFIIGDGSNLKGEIKYE